MRAISASVGVEEGAVRAIEAGADALCLGHDLVDNAVQALVDALAAAVRSGRMPEARLAEAAGRVRRVAGLLPAEARAALDRDVGLEAARRALRVEGIAELTRPALVVELDPEPGLAAGRLGQGPSDWLGAVVPDTEVVRLDGDDVAPARAARDDRQLVLVARDAHRHEWQRTAVEALLAPDDDTILVETGLPHWRPDLQPVAYVATFGAARVNVQALAERLYSRTATRGGAVR
jgi:beta-N-acetylhexosaminidase